MKKVMILAAVLAVAACGKPAPEGDETAATEAATEATETAEAGDSDDAPAAFAQCAVCHTVKKDAPHGVGPNLHGIMGTKAGELEGYAFSPSMKASGLVWDEKTLDAYIEDPRKLVPGTKMSFAGQKDAAKRAEIIAWIKKNS